MKKVAAFVAFLGFVLIIGTAMMTFDTIMTDERKAAFREGVNTQLDDGAQQYEQSREDGCRRRCGFFGTISSMVVDLRDGIFLSMPFDPETVFPPAPEGWAVADYELQTVEAIVEREMRRTAIFVSTQNSLLKEFADIAAANNVGAVRIYYSDQTLIAFAVMIDRNGIRSAKDAGRNGSQTVTSPFISVDGVPFKSHPQEAYEGFNGKAEPVAYRHLSANIDGQVDIAILATAEDAEIAALLSGFDMGPIVEDLPQMPTYYVAGQGASGFAASVEPVTE